MKKELPGIMTIVFGGVTIFQIALFYFEALGRIPTPVVRSVGYLLLPGFTVCLILPISGELYGSMPALLIFPIAVNSFLCTGLFFGLWHISRTLLVQPKNL